MTKNQSLHSWLPKLNNVTVVCIGDVMLDQYVYGDVDRVSPEAPIPVLNVSRRAHAIGGAGNVVCNIAALGGGAHLVAVIGDDPAGRQVRDLLAGVGGTVHRLLVASDRPTTVKTRFIAGSQQLLRVDDETVGNLAKELLETVVEGATSVLAAPGPGAVILSDYGKGVLPDGVIQRLIAASQAAGVPVIVDPKGADYAKYSGADVLTPNRKELSEATRLPTHSSDEIVAAAERLIEICGVRHVLVTRGAEGMSLVSADGAPLHLPALAREIFDVSGAGDTVVAVLATGLAAGMTIAEAAQLANVAAGLVVAKVGTAVVRNAELADAVDVAATISKSIVDEKQLAEQVAQWRSRGLSIGFTNGCFDLVHPGHISLLEQADAQCDRLIIGLNSDASVARLKGAGRPVQNAAARGRVLASVAAVDAVVVFEDDTPVELIRKIRPDVLVKGADYTLDEVVGGEFVRSYGGRVVLADLVDGFSTTETIARLSR
ncbi:MAG: D-beta-D-heptose 7-phosphate kinase/D-beta-D-heptose 1-phosphate adenosyltransferase [Alphaproteobacteria bacterium]|jgi:D-beta-D-heptose 7-phosphate kinase/D-beta-D-heptose 1-phosphate adenosyltransferase